MESEHLARGCELAVNNSTTQNRVKRPALYFDNDDECRELSTGLFGQLDLDRNGSLDNRELEYARQILSSGGVDANGMMSKPLAAFGDLSLSVMEMLGHSDHDGDGTIDREEWDDFIRSVYEIAGRQSFTKFVERWVSAIQARLQSASHPTTLPPISDPDSNHGGHQGGTDSSNLFVGGTGRHRGEINRGATQSPAAARQNPRPPHNVALAPVCTSSPSNGKSGVNGGPASQPLSRSVSPMPASRNGSPSPSQQPSAPSSSSASSKLGPVKDRKKFATTGSSTPRNLAKLPINQVESGVIQIDTTNEPTSPTMRPGGKLLEPTSPTARPGSRPPPQRRRASNAKFNSSEPKDKFDSAPLQLMPETSSLLSPADPSLGTATDSASGQGDVGVDAGNCPNSKLLPDEDRHPIAETKETPSTGIGTALQVSQVSACTPGTTSAPSSQRKANPAPTSKRRNSEMQASRQPATRALARRPSEMSNMGISGVGMIDAPQSRSGQRRHTISENHGQEEPEVQQSSGLALEVKSAPTVQSRLRGKQAHQQVNSGSSGRSRTEQASKGKPQALTTQATDQTSGTCNQPSAPTPILEDTSYEDVSSLGGTTCTHGSGLQDTSWADGSSLEGTICANGPGQQDTTCANGSSLEGTPCAQGPAPQDSTCANGSRLEGTTPTHGSGLQDTTCANGSSLEVTNCAHGSRLEDTTDVLAFTDELEQLINECQVDFGIASDGVDGIQQEAIGKEHGQEAKEDIGIGNPDVQGGGDLCGDQRQEFRKKLAAPEIEAANLEQEVDFLEAEIFKSEDFEVTLSDIGAEPLALGDEAVFEADPLLDTAETNATASQIEPTGVAPTIASVAAVAKIKNMKGAKSGKEKAAQLRRAALTQQAAVHQDLFAVEQPLITLEEVWELVATDRGCMNSRVPVFDLVEIFVDAKESGLGPALATLVPQSFREPEPPEDLSPGEVLDICMMLVHEDIESVTEEHVRRQLGPIRDYCRLLTFKDLCIEPDAHLTLLMFKRLLHLLSVLLRVDLVYVLSHFMWVKTGRFETTDAVAALVIDRCSLRRETARQNLQRTDGAESGNYFEPDLSVLYEGFTTGDFSRLCVACNVIDSKAKNGIPFTHVQVIYLNCIRHMTDYVKKRAEHRTPLGKTNYSDIYNQAQRSFRLHMDYRQQTAELKRTGQSDAKSIEGGMILGRTEFSILLEKLFGGIKKNCPTYKGPLSLCLAVLEKSPDEMVSVSQLR